jgi:hypothetical protein
MPMTAPRTLTQQQLRDEAAARFGPDPMKWAFVCPSCGDVATLQDFKTVGRPERRRWWSR